MCEFVRFVDICDIDFGQVLLSESVKYFHTPHVSGLSVYWVGSVL